MKKKLFTTIFVGQNVLCSFVKHMFQERMTNDYFIDIQSFVILGIIKTLLFVVLNLFCFSFTSSPQTLLSAVSWPLSFTSQWKLRLPIYSIAGKLKDRLFVRVRMSDCDLGYFGIGTVLIHFLDTLLQPPLLNVHKTN